VHPSVSYPEVQSQLKDSIIHVTFATQCWFELGNQFIVGYKTVGDVETSHVITLSFSSVNFAKSFISQKLGKKKEETLIATRIWDFLRRFWIPTVCVCVFFFHLCCKLQIVIFFNNSYKS